VVVAAAAVVAGAALGASSSDPPQAAAARQTKARSRSLAGTGARMTSSWAGRSVAASLHHRPVASYRCNRRCQARGRAWRLRSRKARSAAFWVRAMAAW
jgi:hypothetical protein